MSAAAHMAGTDLESARAALWAPTCSAQETTPLALAVELALFGSDLPGFDNADRQKLRNIARAVLAPDVGVPAALELANAATATRVGVVYQRSRPEATLLVAVQYLLQQANSAAAPT